MGSGVNLGKILQLSAAVSVFPGVIPTGTKIIRIYDIFAVMD